MDQYYSLLDDGGLRRTARAMIDHADGKPIVYRSIETRGIWYPCLKPMWHLQEFDYRSEADGDGEDLIGDPKLKAAYIELKKLSPKKP